MPTSLSALVFPSVFRLSSVWMWMCPAYSLLSFARFLCIFNANQDGALLNNCPFCHLSVFVVVGTFSPHSNKTFVLLLLVLLLFSFLSS